MAEEIQQDDTPVDQKRAFYDIGTRLRMKNGVVYELVRNRGWVLVDDTVRLQPNS